MNANENGYAFGVIAQALWLTQKRGGDSNFLLAILQAKSFGSYDKLFDDYQELLPDVSTIPTSWGQFRKAVMEKDNLGTVMSAKDEDEDKGNAGNQGNGGN